MENVISEETNILIELDNISASIREQLEAIDAVRALTISILQDRIYNEATIRSNTIN